MEILDPGTLGGWIVQTVLYRGRVDANGRGGIPILGGWEWSQVKVGGL